MTPKRWYTARILVVEDEQKVRRGLERGLQSAGYAVATAATGDEGLKLATAGAFDCLVPDWMLPGRDGLNIVRTLRADGRTAPILLLTARDAIEDRVLGLEAGANDYLLKPFALAELLARVMASCGAVSRTARRSSAPPVWRSTWYAAG
jgi:two-component system OmpR family response regulator